MLWLSGETIDPDELRKAIKKEVSILRRSVRGISYSSAKGRARPRIPLPAQTEIFIRDFGFTEGELQATSALALYSDPDFKLAPIMRVWAERMFGEELDDEIVDHPKEDEITMVWRPGYLDISSEKAGSYIDRLRDDDFVIIKTLFQKRNFHGKVQSIFSLKLMPDIPAFLKGSLLSVINMLPCRPEWRINSAIMLAFDVCIDLQNGADPQRRITYLDRQIDSMLDSLRQFAEMKSANRSIE